MTKDTTKSFTQKMLDEQNEYITMLLNNAFYLGAAEALQELKIEVPRKYGTQEQFIEFLRKRCEMIATGQCTREEYNSDD